MPHPFPSTSFEWPGTSLVRRLAERRDRRRATRAMADAFASGQEDRVKDRLVRESLRQGADPNHAFGNTPLRPLEWAVERQRFDLVIDLLDAGAHPEPATGQYLPVWPLQQLYALPDAIEATLFTVTVEGVAWQLRHGGAEGATLAVQGLQALDAFLEHGANPWRTGRLNDPVPSTPLHLLAYMHPSLKGIPEALLHRLDPSRTDVNGDTAAHVLARHGAGSSHILETSLVSRGLVILARLGVRLDEVRNRKGDTPLDLLAQRVNPSDLAPTALGLLLLHRDRDRPDLRWDRCPPHGGPSPLDRLQTLMAQGEDVLGRVDAQFLREFLDVEEHRVLREVAQETVSALPGSVAPVRARSRL